MPLKRRSTTSLVATCALALVTTMTVMTRGVRNSRAGHMAKAKGNPTELETSELRRVKATTGRKNAASKKKKTSEGIKGIQSSNFGFRAHARQGRY
jgi:hypothetical protein